jgi:hypothetical protein
MRKALFAIAAIAALALGGAAEAANQFDLVCTGTKSSTSNHWQGIGRGTPAPTVKDIAVEYRVDLDRGIYCADKCTNISAIYSINPTSIVLARVVLPDAKIDATLAVDRNTGNMVGEAFAPDGSEEVKASCVAQPYTGITTAKF